jgi:DNA repair ATPase RecN
MRNNLKIQNFGQVSEADISFGDLTVFVGPQATGKSIVLQLFKLIEDNRNIVTELKRHGLDWAKNPGDFFDTYFGEGMRTLINDKTNIVYNDKPIDFNKISSAKVLPDKKETMFFIPAQRVLTLRDGWPRPFTDYAPGDPFAVREYSEALRQLMEKEFSDIGKPLFLMTGA